MSVGTNFQTFLIRNSIRRFSLLTEKDDSLLLPAKSSKWYPLHFMIMFLDEDLLNDKLTLKKTGYGISIWN